MDKDNNFDNQISEEGEDFSLESILADFKAEESAMGGGKQRTASAHSRAIVMEALGETIGSEKAAMNSEMSEDGEESDSESGELSEESRETRQRFGKSGLKFGLRSEHKSHSQEPEEETESQQTPELKFGPKPEENAEVFTVYESEITETPENLVSKTADDADLKVFKKENPDGSAYEDAVPEKNKAAEISAEEKAEIESFAISSEEEKSEIADSDEELEQTQMQESAEIPEAEDFHIFPEEEQQDEEERVWSEDAGETERGKKYAKADDYANEADEYDDEADGRDMERQGLLSGIILAAAERRREKAARRAAKLEEEALNLPPEMSPDKACRLYLEQAQTMRWRCLLATLMSAVLVYLSYGLPALGLIGSSVKIRTLVCMILLLVIMLIGLDIFTNGIVSLFKGKPSSESLVSVSCLFSAGDALYIALTGNFDTGLPFCGVSALSMMFALWGYYLNCKSFALSFRTAAIPKSPSVIISMDGIGDSGPVLSKAKRDVTGFVRKSEEADVFESSYSLFSPLLIIFSLILSLMCTFIGPNKGSFLHVFSACLALSASLSAVFGFSYPYYTLTKRLVRSGVTIAGYSGCADLGRIHNVAISDTDLFPARTISIANIHVAEGFYPDKVISYTSSMLSASGIGLSSAFTELMKKNGYAMRPVEDFACHEGGGLVARVSGDLVYVGSSSFMRLMGIKPPKGAGSNSAVYTAINDELAGIFEINYTPVSSVQRGLVTLLRGKTEPVFAVRDFNITPVLVKQKFRLPKDSYDFPSFADRYDISSPEVEAKGSVAAVFSKGGLNSVAGLIKRGRALFNGLRICAVVSVLGAAVGMLLMLFMFWTGANDSASCGNAMTFMLLWLVPVFVISLGLRR